MPPEERLAYVARLLRSFALDYGVGYEFGAGRRGGLVGETDKSSPAAPGPLPERHPLDANGSQSLTPYLTPGA
jgi:hypothetical protein